MIPELVFTISGIPTSYKTVGCVCFRPALGIERKRLRKRALGSHNKLDSGEPTC